MAMSSYEHIKPLLLEKFPDIIHPSLVEVFGEYARYIDYTPIIGRDLTNSEIVRHLEQRDEIGKTIVDIFYKRTYERLDMEEQQYVRIDPEFLVQATVDRFSKAIETLKSMQKSS